MRDTLVHALLEEAVRRLPANDPVSQELMALKSLEPDQAVAMLASLVEAMLRFFASNTETKPETSIAKVITAMRAGGAIPENVADAAYFVSARRNRNKRIHPVGVGMSVRREMGWGELLSLLGCASEVIVWGAEQTEWDVFARSWRSAKCRTARLAASNPLDSWVFCDIGPAALEELPAVVDLDSAAFDDEDVVPASVFQAWQRHDPEVFTCARQPACPLAGYYAVLWMKQPVLDRFLRGEIRERELEPADLCTDAEKDALGSLYVYSIVVRARASSVTPLLLGHLMRRIRAWQASRNLTRLYAVAATPEGRVLIERRFGFRCIDAGCNRPDMHPVYELALDSIDWTEWLAYGQLGYRQDSGLAEPSLAPDG